MWMRTVLERRSYATAVTKMSPDASLPASLSLRSSMTIEVVVTAARDPCGGVPAPEGRGERPRRMLTSGLVCNNSPVDRLFTKM